MRERLKNINKSIFFKYLLSYFIVLLIPVTLLSTFIYTNILPKIKYELESSNTRAIKQMNQLIDSQVMTMQQIADMISNDQTMTRFELQRNQLSAMEAIKQLARYKVSTSFIEDIFLYYKNDDKIYSYMGKSSMHTFSHLIYQYDGWDADSIYRDLNSIKQFVVRPLEKVKRNGTDKSIITFIYPIPINNDNPCGAVLFMISKDTLDTLFNNSLQNYDSYIGIFDENNNLLYELNRGNESLSANMILSNNHDTGNWENVNIDGKIYTQIRHQSQFTNWTIRGMFLTEQFMDDFNRMNKQAYLLIFVTLVVCIIAGYLFTSKNYGSIKNLAEYIRCLFPLASNDAEKNELELIKTTVDYAADRDKNLTININKNKKILLDQKVLMLLQGNLSKEEIHEVLACIGFKETNMRFFVVLLCNYRKHKASEHDLSINWKEKIFQQDTFTNRKGYAIQQVGDEEYLAFLINITETSNIIETQKQIIGEINRASVDIENSDFRFAVGKAYKEAVEIKKSFIEASVAMEHNLLSLNNKVVFFDDIAAAQYEQMWYPVEENLRLQQSLKQGNNEIAIEILHDIFLKLTNSRMSINMIKAICIDIISTIIKIGVELNIKGMTNDLEIAMDFNTYTDLEVILGTSIDKICSCVNEQKHLGNKQLYNEIIAYVNEAFREYDITLTSLAEKFNLSVPYLSTIFKQYTGMTFSDYLSELRIKEVKKLLESSNMPLKKIVESVGYVDLASFNRKFKKCEGITLGQYRSLYSNINS